MENRDNVTEFVLLGLTENSEMQKVLIVPFLLIYIVTIMGNLLIMVTIAASQSLDSPMYFFSGFFIIYRCCIFDCRCSQNDHWLASWDKDYISFQSFMTHVFIDHLISGTEVILPVVMAYDWYVKVKVKLLSCVRLCDPVDHSPPGSSVHGILQARILEWVDISFSRGSSWPRDRTQVSHIAGRCFNLWATREAHDWYVAIWKPLYYWSSWIGGCVSLCCWWPGLEAFYTHWFNCSLFIRSLFMAPMSLTASCVTCTLYWNLLALIPTSLDSLW